MEVGFASGAMNLVFPARAGDIAAVALLRRRCKLSSGVAAYAIGMASFFEAAVFGLMMLGILAWNSTQWKLLLGENLHAQAFQSVTLLTLGARQQLWFLLHSLVVVSKVVQLEHDSLRQMIRWLA